MDTNNKHMVDTNNKHVGYKQKTGWIQTLNMVDTRNTNGGYKQ